MFTLKISFFHYIKRVVNKHFEFQNLFPSCTKCWPCFVNISFMKKRWFFSSSYLIRLEGFLLTAPYDNYSIFLLSHSIRLGVFLSSNQASFSSQSLTRLRGFFTMLQTKHHKTFKQSSRLRRKKIVIIAITSSG